MNLYQKLKNKIKIFSLWYKISDSKMFLKLRGQKAINDRIEELKFYRSVIGNNKKLIFDVGANVGNKSIIFSEISKSVLLFEPDITNVKILKARFKNKSNYIIIDCALSNQKGGAEYYAISDDSAYNSLSEKHILTVAKARGIINGKNKLTSYKVRTNTLSFFIEKYGLPDYLKLDVEGYEKEVLLGLDRMVPFISFEANLPQFLSETIEIIDYLDCLSKNTYFYNFSINNKLELNRFISSIEFKKILDNQTFRSIEVYCNLIYLNT
jgi:FkbM family methyltransferase